MSEIGKDDLFRLPSGGAIAASPNHKEASDKDCPLLRDKSQAAPSDEGLPMDKLAFGED